MFSPRLVTLLDLVEPPGRGELAGIKSPAVDRVDDMRRPGGMGRITAQNSGFGTVGVDQVHLFILEDPPEGPIGFPIPGG